MDRTNASRYQGKGLFCMLILPTCLTGYCLRFADKLLVTVPRTSMHCRPKTFTVSATAVWSSHLTVDPVNCSVFLSVLRIVPAISLPLIRLRHGALYKSVLIV